MSEKLHSLTRTAVSEIFHYLEMFETDEIDFPEFSAYTYGILLSYGEKVSLLKSGDSKND